MNQDLISRQAILKHIEKKRQDALMIDDLRESNIIMMGMKLLEEAVRNQPSAQPEQIARDIATIIENEQDMRVVLKNAEHTETHDLVSRQSAIKTFHDEIVRRRIDEDTNDDGTLDEFDTEAILRRLPSVQPESRREWYMHGYRDAQPRWIPIKWHDCTAEEREEYGFGEEIVTVFDCDMPSDNQEILVTTSHGYVEKDVCYIDDGFSLDSGYDWIEDITAWMPLPEPYKEGQDGTRD